MSRREDDTDPAREVAALKSQLAVANRRIAALEARANEDPLLGILNRRGFLAEVERAVSFSARYRVPAALLYCDLDGFKGVNDHHGHDIGDQVLQHAVMVMEANIRGSDRIGRIGGDEFAILLWHADEEIGGWKAQVLAAMLASTPFQRDGLRIAVEASFGVAQLCANDTARKALARADRSMYAAKGAARVAPAQES